MKIDSGHFLYQYSLTFQGIFCCVCCWCLVSLLFCLQCNASPSRPYNKLLVNSSLFSPQASARTQSLPSIAIITQRFFFLYCISLYEIWLSWTQTYLLLLFRRCVDMFAGPSEVRSIKLKSWACGDYEVWSMSSWWPHCTAASSTHSGQGDSLSIVHQSLWFNSRKSSRSLLDPSC